MPAMPTPTPLPPTPLPPTEALTAEDVKAILREGPTDVTFIKQNGEFRRGNFTLAQNLIPEECQPKGERSPSDTEIDGTIVRAFDVDKQAFRTITVPNIVAIFSVSV